MKMKTFVVGATLALLVGCGTEEVYFANSLNDAQAKAVDAAVHHAGFGSVSDVRLKKCERDFEDGVSIYEVKFKHGWYEYEYDVDAATGKILKMKKEFDW